MDYYEKYLKYKIKYLQLKKIHNNKLHIINKLKTPIIYQLKTPVINQQGGYIGGSWKCTMGRFLLF
jgi:hypothetical protein